MWGEEINMHDQSEEREGTGMGLSGVSGSFGWHVETGAWGTECVAVTADNTFRRLSLISTVMRFLFRLCFEDDEVVVHLEVVFSFRTRTPISFSFIFIFPVNWTAFFYVVVKKAKGEKKFTETESFYYSLQLKWCL